MATVYVPVLAARILLKGTDQNRPQSFSLWAAKPVPVEPTYSELVSLADAVAGAIPGNAFLPNLGVPFAFTGVEAHDAAVIRGPSATSLLSTAGTGTDILPTAAAARVALAPSGSAAFRRPSLTFLPAVPSSGISGSGTSNTLSSAYITAANTFIASLQTAIASVSPYALVAVSRRFNGAPRASGLISPVTSIACRPTVATQVRRQRRVSRKA